MATDQTVTEIFPVGKYTCTMTIGELGMTAEWEPDIPIPGTLTAKEMRQYRRGRTIALEKMADIMGGEVMCIDI